MTNHSFQYWTGFVTSQGHYVAHEFAGHSPRPMDTRQHRGKATADWQNVCDHLIGSAAVHSMLLLLLLLMMIMRRRRQINDMGHCGTSDLWTYYDKSSSLVGILLQYFGPAMCLWHAMCQHNRPVDLTYVFLSRTVFWPVTIDPQHNKRPYVSIWPHNRTRSVEPADRVECVAWPRAEAWSCLCPLTTCLYID